jgi:branched-subunit amino acid transport protein
MTWLLIVTLLIGTYLIRAVGLVVLADRQLPRLVTDTLMFVPAAILAALIAVQTVSTDGVIQFDARLIGVAAALIAVTKRLPFGVVFLIGVGTTAIARWLIG